MSVALVSCVSTVALAASILINRCWIRLHAASSTCASPWFSVLRGHIRFFEPTRLACFRFYGTGGCVFAEMHAIFFADGGFFRAPWSRTYGGPLPPLSATIFFQPVAAAVDLGGFPLRSSRFAVAWFSSSRYVRRQGSFVASICRSVGTAVNAIFYYVTRVHVTYIGTRSIDRSID